MGCGSSSVTEENENTTEGSEDEATGMEEGARAEQRSAGKLGDSPPSNGDAENEMESEIDEIKTGHPATAVPPLLNLALNSGTTESRAEPTVPLLNSALESNRPSSTPATRPRTSSSSSSSFNSSRGKRASSASSTQKYSSLAQNIAWVDIPLPGSVSEPAEDAAHPAPVQDVDEIREKTSGEVKECNHDGSELKKTDPLDDDFKGDLLKKSITHEDSPVREEAPVHDVDEIREKLSSEVKEFSHDGSELQKTEPLDDFKGDLLKKSITHEDSLTEREYDVKTHSRDSPSHSPSGSPSLPGMGDNNDPQDQMNKIQDQKIKEENEFATMKLTENGELEGIEENELVVKTVKVEVEENEERKEVKKLIQEIEEEIAEKMDNEDTDMTSEPKTETKPAESVKSAKSVKSIQSIKSAISAGLEMSAHSARSAKSSHSVDSVKSVPSVNSVKSSPSVNSAKSVPSVHSATSIHSVNSVNSVNSVQSVKSGHPVKSFQSSGNLENSTQQSGESPSSVQSNQSKRVSLTDLLTENALSQLPSPPSSPPHLTDSTSEPSEGNIENGNNGNERKRGVSAKSEENGINMIENGEEIDDKVGNNKKEEEKMIIGEYSQVTNGGSIKTTVINEGNEENYNNENGLRGQEKTENFKGNERGTEEIEEEKEEEREGNKRNISEGETESNDKIEENGNTDERKREISKKTGSESHTNNNDNTKTKEIEQEKQENEDRFEDAADKKENGILLDKEKRKSVNEDSDKDDNWKIDGDINRRTEEEEEEEEEEEMAEKQKMAINLEENEEWVKENGKTTEDSDNNKEEEEEEEEKELQGETNEEEKVEKIEEDVKEGGGGGGGGGGKERSSGVREEYKETLRSLTEDSGSLKLDVRSIRGFS